MKKVFSIMFALLMVLGSVSMASAQIGTTDNSSFSIQNLGAAVATVTITFYDETGTPIQPTELNNGKSNPFTLNAGQGWEIYLPGIPDSQLADGRYSVVIESTEPVAVVANLIGETGTFDFNGSYSGFEAGATNVYLPSIFYNYYGWYSFVSVQNVTASAVNITVNYYQGSTLIAKHTANNVPAFASAHFDWETNPPTVEAGQALPTPNEEPPLSAVVEATGNVVAVDNQTVPSSGYMQSYNGFLQGANTLYAPSLFSSYYGWFSSLLIQNVGGVATQVTVDYNDAATNDVFTLQPREARQLIYRADSTPAHPAQAAFGATITSVGAPVVAIINQASWPQAPTFAHSDQAQTYNAFAQGYSDWGLPTIFQKYYSWDTSFSFMNVGGSSTDVTVTYSANQNPAGAPYAGCTFTVSLAAGASIEYYQPNHASTPPAGCVALPNDYQGSVTLSSSASPIVAQVNETNDPMKVQQGGDWSMSYNGFGQ